MNEIRNVRIGNAEQIGHASAVLEEGEELCLAGEGFAFRVTFAERTNDAPSVVSNIGEKEISFILKGFDIAFSGVTWSSEVIGTADDGRSVFLRVYVRSVISEKARSRFINLSMMAREK